MVGQAHTGARACVRAHSACYRFEKSKSVVKDCVCVCVCVYVCPQTLARIMREEMKKSIDLCINIVSVFFSISNFSQFHQLIMDNQVGDTHR